MQPLNPRKCSNVLNISKIHLKHDRSKMSPDRINKFKAEIDVESKNCVRKPS